MEDVLRVLLVEDNEADAELVQRTLARGTATVEVARVADEASLRATLAGAQWNVVISDYAMPGFSAPEALRVVQESGQDLPFIVVSGTIGEATAVEMMRAGAQDYLMKDNLARLLPAVESEIANARTRRERREAQAAREESEERYRGLYNAIAGGVIVEGVDGRIIEANDIACSILGRGMAEMAGHGADDIAWHALREDGTIFPRHEHPTAVTLRNGLPVHGVTMAIPHPKTGRLTWILVSSEPILDPVSGAVTASVATFTDITERQEAAARLRESEERFRAIFNHAAVGIAITGMDGRELDCNQAMADMLGMTREEYLTTPPDLLFHPEERERDPRLWDELAAGLRSSYQRETRMLHRDGHAVWVRLTVSLAAFGDVGERAAVTMIEDISAHKRADERLRESEQRYREMFEHMSSGVVVYEATADGAEFLIRDFNGAAERIEGTTRNDVLGRSLAEAFPGATTMGLPDVLRRVWQTGSPEYYAPVYYQDPQREGWRENFVYRLPSHEVVAIYDDVTERVEAQRSVHESTERLRAVVDAAPVAIVMMDPEGAVLLWNQAAESIFGWSEEQVLGGLFPGQDAADQELFSTIAREVAEGRRFTDLELRVSRQDRSPLDVSLSAGPVHDPEGDVVATMCVLADITERTRAARMVQEREERFRLLYQEAPIPYQSLSQEGHFLDVNRVWLEAMGYSREEVLGHHFTEFIAPDEREAFAARFEYFLSAGRIGGVQITMVHRDGSRIVTEHEGRVTYNPDGSFKQTHCVFQDVTARLAAEQALAAEKERLAVTLRSIGDSVIATDTDGRVVVINRAAERLTDWTEAEAIGRHIDEVLHLAIERRGRLPLRPVPDVLTTHTTREWPGRIVLSSANGAEYVVAASGAPIRDARSQVVGVVLVLRDVTEEQHLRAEALKAQKLESLGVLAGGIAHDFNNALLVITGNLQMAQMLGADNDQHGTLLHNAEQAAVQARDLTQQLLTFAKGGAPVKEVASIGHLIRDTVLFAISGSNVRCEFDIAGDLRPVEVDLGQLSQVVNNLVINADQAMPNGGVMQVSLQNVALDESSGLPLPPGDYVRLSITDTGTGIAPEHLDRIFDPYFTTKSRGNGLGLASSYSIVQRHGGHLGVTSEVGVGSTFTIHLPTTQQMATSQETAERTIATGTGRVLVMDDEEAVRELAIMLLSDLGYTVEAVNDGETALARYREAREAGERFDAVILDLTIRGAMGGTETIAALRELDPTVRAVVCSGYSADPVMAQYEQYGFCAVVVKPYDVAELAEAVAHAVAGG